MQVKASEGRGCGSLQSLRDILLFVDLIDAYKITPGALMRDFLVISEVDINYIVKTFQKILQNLQDKTSHFWS